MTLYCDHRTFSDEVLAQAKARFPERWPDLWEDIHQCCRDTGHEGLHWGPLRNFHDFGGYAFTCWDDDGQLVDLPTLVRKALAELEEMIG